jgi:serine/threonine protein kinase/Leucine-rich repeat (LRR) protein
MAVAAQCPDPKQLQALMLGRLSEKAAASLEHHLASCGRCCAVLRTLPADDTLVEAMRARAKIALHPAEQDVVEGLMGRMRKLRPVAAAAHDTATGEHTKGDAEPMSANRESFGFLNPPHSPEELGRLGPYRVLKVLGHGGMGMVFLAEDPRLKRTVALKVMLPEVAKKETARERFLREARATAAIEHDHIITIYQVDEDRGVPYLAMPLLKGMSLESYLKRAKETKKPLTLGQILKLAREIAKGLAAAHERGLIHRDIKPANIWLDATAGGRVKILDFGLARPTETDSTITQSGMIVGTPAYMAPEQAAGQKIDGRADLFSLGCVLYRLCSGHLPWHGETAMATLMAVATEEETPLGQLNPDLPPALTELVAKLLAKKPEGRPRSAKAVVEAIVAVEKQLAADKVPVAQTFQVEPGQWQQFGEPSETAPLVKVRKPIKKRPRRWPLVAVAAAVLMIGGGVALWQVIIRVETKDGKIAELKVPDRSTVTIKGDGKIIVEPSGKGAVGQGRGSDDARLKMIEKLGVPSAGIFKTESAAFKQRAEAIAKLPPEKQAEAVSKWLVELNPGFDGQINPQIWGGAVGEVKLFTDKVTDISPVRALKDLKQLICPGSAHDKGKLVDLSPIGGMKLKQLIICCNPGLTSLEPVRGMPLQEVNIVCTQVGDLSPLTGMPIERLFCTYTPVADLTPLRGSPLTLLHAAQTKIDLARLRDFPLKHLACDFQPGRDVAALRSIKTLETINDKPAAEVLKQASAANAAFERWLKDTQKLPAEKQVEAVLAKLKELNPGFDGVARGRHGQPPYKIEGGVVTELRFPTDKITDIAPVVALKGLQKLDCAGSAKDKGQLADLSPLRGMVLTSLSCDGTKVVDLSPLKGMPLTFLEFGNAPVADLSPLAGMPLRYLICNDSKVSDLSPLKGLPLIHLNCRSIPATDFSPLLGLPLTTVRFDKTAFADLSVLRGSPIEVLFVTESKVTDLSPLQGKKLTEFYFTPQNITKGTEVLRQMKSLQAIGTSWDAKGKLPPQEFWKQYDAKYAAFEQWLKDTQKLPAEKQVEAVAAKLKELNPGFDGQLTRGIEGGAVIELNLVTDEVSDLAPLRALTGLKKLTCRPAHRDYSATPRKGKLADLSPVKGMALVELHVIQMQVADLSPLQGMPLKILEVNTTNASSIAPLKGLQLEELVWNWSSGSDLSPLKGMPLVKLSLDGYQGNDLSPLQGIRLTLLSLRSSRQVADLSPLKGMPLTYLAVGEGEFTDLSPLAGMPLTRLDLTSPKLEDLTPLKGMKLTYLDLHNCHSVTDVTVLQSMPLTHLSLVNTRVTDLSVLRGMPLTGLGIDYIPAKDLSPLRGLPLTTLHLRGDKQQRDLTPLQGLSLKEISLSPKYVNKGMDVLRQIKSLQLIRTGYGASTEFAPAEFWKRYEAGEFNK